MLKVILPKQSILTAGLTLLVAGVMWPHLTRGELKSAEGINQRINLPAPRTDSAISIEKALRERRSVREFKRKPLTFDELSQLLWAAQGISGPAGLRTAPSAGALYPLEVYAVVGRVEGLAAGVYKYNPRGHELVRTLEGDKRTGLSEAALSQTSVREAAAVFVFAAVYERTTAKYGSRGLRYVHMEAGHAGQNVCLQAVALNLGAVVTGAFDDEKVKKIVRMTAKEEPLYLIPVGRK